MNDKEGGADDKEMGWEGIDDKEEGRIIKRRTGDKEKDRKETIVKEKDDADDEEEDHGRGQMIKRRRGRNRCQREGERRDI